MKFTRIKNSFSQNRRIPRLGRIRLGLKVQKRRPDGSVVEYPTEVSHFVTPPEVQAVYGPNPTELDIMLPSENEEAVFPQSLAWFGRSKGLRCKGDGENAERLNEQTGQWEPRTCPCEHYKTKDNPKGECTEQGILMFILPKVSMGGTYQLRTGSYNSVVDMNSGLDYVRALIGRISMIPLKLRRVARETHAEGKRQTHYTLSLTLDATVEGINQLRSDSSRILSHAQLQIEGPIEENPALDPPDIMESSDWVDADGKVDAEDLADLDDTQVEQVRQKLAERQAENTKKAEPKKAEPKQAAPKDAPKQEAPNVATPTDLPDIEEAVWTDTIAAIDDDPYLRDIKEQIKAKYKLPSLHYGKLTANGRQGFLKHFKAAAAAAGFGGKLKNLFNEQAVA